MPPQHQVHEQSVKGLLDSAKDFLPKVSFPQGSFDSSGTWKQSLVIWLKGRDMQAGTMDIARQALKHGTFSLDVQWQVNQTSHVVHHVAAQMICQADELATPISWKLQTTIVREDGSAVPDAASQCEGRCKGGIITYADGRKLYADKPLTAWTSNFSIIEAVQRLAKLDRPAEFTMIEFFDVRKDGQRLSFLGKQEVELAGQKVQLTGYAQVGDGILPIAYWLDQQQRLRFVVSGLRGMIAVAKEAKA